jgi:diguanylate cyclase (GGDEF)-like protein
MCLPLIGHVGLIGMLFLNAAPGNIITKNQIQLANTFSEIIKLFLANIQLRGNLLEQAIHDPLTGLFNRRHLDEILPREMQHVIREQRPLCVAMIDIDHFKIFNDTYGHDAGDAVLKHLGDLIKRNFRAGDIPFRFGGEEFIVILINSELQGAIPRLQTLCDKIKSTRFPFNDLILPKITVSIGVAQAPKDGTTTEEILRAADEALYAAKNSGRDRIEVYQVNSSST